VVRKKTINVVIGRLSLLKNGGAIFKLQEHWNMDLYEILNVLVLFRISNFECLESLIKMLIIYCKQT
jgi:hypothetical protein